MNGGLHSDGERTPELLSLFLKDIPYAIAVFDTEMRYVAYSQCWLDDYHLPQQSLIGRTHYEVFPEINDEWNQIHRRCLAGEILSRVDDPFVRDDGRIDYVTWKIIPREGDDGSVVGIVMYTKVSTPQVIAEKTNREYEHELRILLESTKAVPWRMDYLSGEFTYMGSQVEELLGYPANSWKSLETWASRIHPEDRESAVALCQEKAAEGCDHDFEYRTISASGDTVWLRDVVSVTKDEQGSVIALVGLFLDISGQKASEECLRASKTQYHSVIETSGDGFWLTDSRGFILETNDAYSRLSGYSKEDLVGMHVSDLDAQEQSEETAEHIEKIIRTGSDLFETTHRKKSGEIWHVEISTSFTYSSGGLFFVFSRDITERKRTQQELRLIAEIFENTSEGIVITDPEGVIVNVNNAYCAITGYSAEEMIGAMPSKIKSDRHDKGFYKGMWKSITENGFWVGEIWDRRKSGEVFPKWLSINAIHDENGKLSHYVGTFSDITVLKGIEQELEQMAYHDPLTKLPNRVLFKDRLETEIARCKRYGYQCALLFLDLDQFKLVNDTLGHAVGDELLVNVAHCIQKMVRANDTVARMGGDEFTILLTRLNNTDAAATMAQSVIDELLKPINLMNEEIRVGGSIGVAIYPDDGKDFSTLTRHADAAMYVVKSRGRGHYHFYSEDMERSAQEHLKLKRDLYHAIEQQQFFLVFQPQVDANNGRTVRCEALIRWQHPVWGLVPPDKFIPIAEDGGLILPIGDWVIREVCKQLQLWQANDVEIPAVAINLSARQFRQDGLVERIIAILDEYQVPVELIEFEITETVAMENAESTMRRLSALAARGFSIAIDDFGAGYSSLSYLKTFQVNKLKLDRSFVRDIPDDGNDAAISSAVIQMANSLGLEVVAEGVETGEQRDFLLSQGCRIMQGYLFSKPLSADDYTEHFTRQCRAREIS